MSSDLLRDLKRKEKYKLFFQYGLLLFFFSQGVLRFLTGKNGVFDGQELEKKITLYVKKADVLRQRLQAIESEIYAFKTNDFKVELFARQNLHMVRANEKLYLCPKE